MMNCPWTEPQDLQKYMNGVVVLYDEQPIQCNYDGVDHLVVYDLLTQKALKKIKPNDPLLDIESPEIGYMNRTDPNGNNTVYWLEREPHRQWQQGLTKANTCTYKIDGGMVGAYQNLFYSQGLIDMIVGKYPTLQEAFVLLKKYKEIAISRSVAIEGNPEKYPANIYYKGEKVGYIEPGTMVVKVPSSTKAWIVSKFLGQFTWEVV